MIKCVDVVTRTSNFTVWAENIPNSNEQKDGWIDVKKDVIQSVEDAVAFLENIFGPLDIVAVG